MKAFEELLTELTNASYDCGEYDFDNEENTVTYQELLERFRKLKEEVLKMYEETRAEW